MFCCVTKIEIPFCFPEAINTHPFFFFNPEEITNTSLFLHFHVVLWFGWSSYLNKELESLVSQKWAALRGFTCCPRALKPSKEIMAFPLLSCSPHVHTSLALNCSKCYICCGFSEMMDSSLGIASVFMINGHCWAGDAVRTTGLGQRRARDEWFVTLGLASS